MVGSSPLTRGKPIGGDLSSCGCGLIPAHAGKTRRGASRRCRSRAHPRSRGENTLPVKVNEESTGSSPLTRGKRRQLLGRPAVPGLIPAHAGKTPRPAARPSRARAHPRSRGENTWDVLGFGRAVGSSPLTRGKLASAAGVIGTFGLIPAHAGKTRLRRRAAAPRWAHPRSRGENQSSPQPVGWLAGSSPLTRGKPCRPPCSSRATTAHPRSRGEN